MIHLPRELLRSALLEFFFTEKNKNNIFNIKRVLPVSKYIKKCITTSQLYLNTRLILEVPAGDIATVKKLLRSGADFRAHNCMSIHGAIQNNNNGILHCLISQPGDIDIKILNILCSHDKYPALKIHINNKKISSENLNGWMEYCIECDDVEAFNILWLLIKGRHLLDFDIYDFDTYPELEEHIIYNIIDTIIETEDNDERLFKHIMKSPEMSRYVYDNPFYGGTHIIEKLFKGKSSGLIQYIDMSKFDRQILIAYACAHNNTDGCPTCMSISRKVGIIVEFLIDNYKKIPYDKLAIHVLDAQNPALIDKFLNHGYKAEQLLDIALRNHKYAAASHLMNKVIPESYLKIMRDIIKSGKMDEHQWLGWARYIKLTKSTPEELIHTYLKYIFD